MRKKTFTLLELSVVLLIIGVLITLSIAQYIDSRELSKMQVFETNIIDIQKALSTYKSNQILLGIQTKKYPISLSDNEFKLLFERNPINPYTGKTMLSDNPNESGIQYISNGLTYNLCVTQRDIEDVNKNNNYDEPLPVSIAQICGYVPPTTPGTYYVTFVTDPTSAGAPTALPNPATVGQSVILTANPDSCYNFSSWSVSAGTLNGDTLIMPAQNVTATANYTIKRYNIFVITNDTTYGTITGSGTYNCGSTATVVASPNPGYRFDGWYEGATRVSTNTTYSFTVSGNRALEARFIANTYTITLKSNPSNAGSPTATPNPAYVGQTVTLSANPDSCYNFSNWSVSAGSLSGNTLTMPAQNVTAIANYTVKRYNISVSPNNSAYGTVTGSGTYDCGSTATVTAIPNTGYQFTGWYENGSQVSTATTYIFTVRDNRTLEARFAINITIAFARNSVAYTSNGIQVAAGVPRYETGKFGQAIFIEEGTTNLFTANQSSIEVNTSGLYGYNGSISKNDDISKSWHGNSSLSVGVYANVAGGVWFSDVSVSANTVYTVSNYISAINEQQLRLSLEWLDSTTWILPTAVGPTFTTNNKMTRQSLTATSLSGAIRTRLTIYTPDTSQPSFTFYVDGAQLEAKPYATSWTLGGTTRAQETLSISPVSSILTPQQGTIDVWVYVPDFWKPGIPYWRRIWGIGRDAGAGMYWLGYDPVAGKITFSIYNNAGTAQTITANKPAVGWHLFTARWSASEMSLWIDGVKMGSKTSPSLPTNFADTILTIGCRPDTPYDNVNTLIDDFRVSNRARTDQEIQALYQSNQPAPKDTYTTLKLNFDGNLNP